MSTPTDSVAPPFPTGTSSPWPMPAWWKRIADWIAALSPSGASEYDTGWVDVPLLPDFTNHETLQIRRIGQVVYLSGRVTGSYTTLNQNIATVPPEFRPARTQRLSITMGGNATIAGSLLAADVLVVSASVADTTQANLFVSWPLG